MRCPECGARFFRLKAGDTFFLPQSHRASLQDEEAVTKVNPIQYFHLGFRHCIWPFTRVKTTVFLRDVLKGGKSANPNDPTIASARSVVKDSGLRPFRAADYQRGPVQTSSSVESCPSA